MSKSSQSKKVAKSNKPVPFADSFTTSDACFSVEVKDPWGEVTEDIEVKIDCGGMIHGDEELIDVLIEMLENAKENLAARRHPAHPSYRPSRTKYQTSAEAKRAAVAEYVRRFGKDD